MATPELGFRIDRMADGRAFKRRDDGRVGLCVGDEGLLWDALQAARGEVVRLTEQVRRLSASGPPTGPRLAEEDDQPRTQGKRK